ncbi:MAG: DUF3089 domain-containing protein [Acidimicrobiia bacterium]
MRRIAITLVIGILATTGLVLVASDAAGAHAIDAKKIPKTVWLCRPGHQPDPCTMSRAATLVAANGSTRHERPVTAKKQPIDCFYVYPTVSLQPTINADLHIDPNEINVAKAQASRFSQVCHVWAPMYRQLTLQAIGGKATAEAAAIAYGDVRNAWLDYLAHDNHGRGVVLIGHSQGAGMLIQLVKQEIEPKPKVRAKLVAAFLLGGNVTVPNGKDVGGDFAHIPACRKPTQNSCVVAFSTFDHTPPPNAIFGRVDAGFNQVRGASASDAHVLCVNPAALRGGKALVHAYFPVHLKLGVLGGALQAKDPAAITTPWVAFPGLYRAECRNENGASWLGVDDQRRPGDVRPQLVDSLGETWGLHLVDANIAAGDLVTLAGTEGRAWAKHHHR